MLDYGFTVHVTVGNALGVFLDVSGVLFWVFLAKYYADKRKAEAE